MNERKLRQLTELSKEVQDDLIERTVYDEV